MRTHSQKITPEKLKQNHPEITVVLGGYGTAIFKEPFEISKKLKEHADFISFGEGLSFMNSLICDKWNIKNASELKQDLLPSKNSFFRTRIELFKQIILVNGLGCVYGCSFCATSGQFNRKYVSLFSGEALFKCLQEQNKKYPKVQSAIIYDEDFLLDKKKVLEFKKHFEQSDLKKQAILLTVFASVKSIQNYTIEELIACGIGTIFIGVESFNDDVVSSEGLTKRTGEIEDLFLQLHSNGINTLGSLIIGWDSQTGEVAKADSQKFIEINPTFYQVVPLHAVPGTKLWEDMKLQDRIPHNYTIVQDGINDFNFNLQNFSYTWALDLISATYKGLV
ncbi:MAG: hypothetical protein HC905_20355 [Bacteroidales bacterium]|nr:hypothetical protein [Bacteroidales bacterium]